MFCPMENHKRICLAILTPKQYYGGVNRKWDRRAKLLLSLGFTYNRVEEHGFAVFTRTKLGKVCSIPSVFLSGADKRLWTDKLCNVLSRG